MLPRFMPRNYSTMSRSERNRHEVIDLANYAIELFKDCQSEEILVVDASDRILCRYWAKKEDGSKRIVSGRYPYDSKQNKIIIKGLVVFGKNGCLKGSIDKDEFKDMVIEGEPNMYRRDLNQWLKGTASKRIFEVGDKIRLLYPPKELLT